MSGGGWDMDVLVEEKLARSASPLCLSTFFLLPPETVCTILTNSACSSIVGSFCKSIRYTVDLS